MLTAFQPVARSIFTMSVSRSTSNMGGRCGSNFLICSTSSVPGPETSREVSVIGVPFAATNQLAHRMHFPQPFSYRLCGNTAIILASFDHLAGDHGAACCNPGA